jgi:hypothetical protein
LAERLEQHRLQLLEPVKEYVQVRKGTGSTLALDTSATIALLQKVEPVIDLPEPEETAPDRTLRLQLTHRLPQVLATVRDEAAAWYAAVSPLLGPPDEWPTTAKELTRTEEELQSASYPLSRRQTLVAELPRPSDVAAALRLVDQLLREWESTTDIDRARRVAKLPWARFDPILAYAEATADAYEKVRERARTNANNGETASPLSDLEDALRDVDAALSAMVPEESE